MNKDKNKDKSLNDESNKINIERNKNEEQVETNAEDNAKKLSGETEQIEELKQENLKNREKIEILEKEITDFKDKLLRKAAEFENYKRRTENDQLNLLTYAAESFIVKILPVYDDLERSLNHLDEENNIGAVKEGLQLVFNKFSKVLDDQGVKKIFSKGTPFDVKYHEALMQTKAEGVPPHTVIDEVEAGYIYKDKVIRHAKVIVSEDVNEENNTQSNF
jgi:molecular chaperone GrpE